MIQKTLFLNKQKKKTKKLSGGWFYTRTGERFLGGQKKAKADCLKTKNKISKHKNKTLVNSFINKKK